MSDVLIVPQLWRPTPFAEELFPWMERAARKRLGDILLMAGSKSIFWAKASLDEILGATDFAVGPPTHVGLWTAALDDTSTGSTASEANYGSYARVAYTNNTTNWPNATGSSIATKSNGTAITFATSTSGSNTITYAALLSASSAGNILYWFSTNSTVIASGDTPKFNASSITVTED